MQRRKFLKASVIGAIGTHFAIQNILTNQLPSFEQESDLIKPNVDIYPDGSFDISSGSIKLTGCYPQIDQASIHPIAIQIDPVSGGQKITYFLTKNRFVELTVLNFNDRLTIQSSFTEFEEAPRIFSPVGNAQIVHADRFYKQGMGFGGPSGIYPFPVSKPKIENAVLKEEVWSYDSYLFSAVINDDTTMAFATFDHENYVHKTKFFNKQERFGLIDRHLNQETTYLETGFKTENIQVKLNQTQMPDIHFITGKNPFNTLHRMARQMADYKQIKTNKPPRYHYCSWYDEGPDFDHQDLSELLKGLKKANNNPGIQTIQIDAGYSLLGDWLNPTDEWPDGLQGAFSKIRKAGYAAGIWIGPFMVNTNSFIYKEHPDWLLHDLHGNMIVEWEKDTHSDGSVCILDTSHPEAFAYLRKVFKTMRQWGATYFKTDFMDWGLQDSKKVKRYTPGKTSAQYFTDVVKMIREEIGNDSYWLGCIAPFEQLAGFVDGMRVANDVHYSWSEGGTVNMFKEMYADQFFNNILWQNDPDVTYMRDYNNELTPEEMKSIAYYNGIMGGAVNTSDKFHLLSEDQLRLFRFIKPGDQIKNATLPNWFGYENIVAVKKISEKDFAILIVNYSNKQVKETYSIKTLTGNAKIFAFDWSYKDSAPLGEINELRVDLQPHASVLIFASVDNNAPSESTGINGISIYN